MSKKISVLALVVSIVALGLILFRPVPTGQTAVAPSKESAYERVMRTKTLRCAYIVYEPYIIKDPNTGKLSGVTVDYVNKIAARQGITVDWASEVNIDQAKPALEGKRFDAFCVPCTPDQNWEKAFEFGGDLGAIPYFTYVAADSQLTDAQLQTATFTLIDGFALSEITRQSYPHAQTRSLPQTTPMAEMYDQLRYKKSDALVNDHISAANYMRANPNIIRRFSDKPVVAMKMFLVADKGDVQMKDFFDRYFDSSQSENLPLMRDTLAQYNVPEGAILLGNACQKSETTEKGWKVCVP